MSAEKKPLRYFNAIFRMELATRTVSAWRTKGLAPRVLWEPIVQIVDVTGEPLKHPAGCLLEVLWLLKDPQPKREEPIEAAIYARQMAERGPGGIA